MAAKKKSGERPGTEQARELFSVSCTSTWGKNLNLYDYAVKLVGRRRKKEIELVKLDHQHWKKNNPIKHFLTLSELSDVMKWKLLRGKSRPIQHLVDSNANSDVVVVTEQAIKLIRSGDKHWKEALEKLSELKGFGEFG